MRLSAPDLEAVAEGQSEDSPIWRLPLKQGHHLTPEARVIKMNLFLEEFAKRGIIADALQAAGMSSTGLKRWKEQYPKFMEAYEEAHIAAQSVLENEAFNRAVVGWEEPVYQGGELVGTIKRKSDRILEVMLKAKVEGYNPKLEVSGEVRSNRIDALPADAVESLLRIVEAAEARGLLDKPDLIEGDFRPMNVDTSPNAEDE